MASAVSVVDVELAESLDDAVHRGQRQRKKSPPTSDEKPLTQREARRLVVDYYRRIGRVLRSLAIGADQRQPAVLISPVACVVPDAGRQLQDRLDEMSDREREVLARLLEGDSEKEAGLILKISRHTVHDHVKQIYRRLKVSSRGELLALFVNRRW